MTTLKDGIIALLKEFEAFFSDELQNLCIQYKPLLNHVGADLKTDAINDGGTALAAALAAAPGGAEAMGAAALAAVGKAAAEQGMTELTYVTQQVAALNAVAQAQLQLGQSPVNKPVVNQ